MHNIKIMVQHTFLLFIVIVYIQRSTYTNTRTRMNIHTPYLNTVVKM